MKRMARHLLLQICNLEQIQTFLDKTITKPQHLINQYIQHQEKICIQNLKF